MSYVNAPATRMLATQCCVCAHPLLDATSVELGIGPVCRRDTGLPTVEQGEANALVRAVACAGKATPEQLRRLVDLGYPVLAGRIASRVGTVKIEGVGSALAVSAPYRREALPAWRGVPGRRWDGRGRRNMVPTAQRDALLALLREHYGDCALVEDGEERGPLFALPAPKAKASAPAPESSKPAVTVERRGARYAVAAPRLDRDGFGTLLAAFRAIPSRRWDAERRENLFAPGDVRAAVDAVLAVAPGATVQGDLPKQAAAAPPSGEDAAERARAAGLYGYQQQGAAWLSTRRRALLADDMGVGKTAQVLAALPERARAIVICPATLKRNWADEVAKWRPDLAAHICNGRGSLRAPREGEVVIANYDVVSEDDAVHADGCVVVLDEAHYTKSHRAKRSEAAAALCKRASHAWLLTGTPMLGRPLDLWGVLRTGELARGAFGGWRSFVRLFGGRKNRWGGWEWAPRPAPEVPSMLRRVMLRRTKAEVLPELPDVRTRDVTINGVPAALRKMLDEAWEAWQQAGDPNALPAFKRMSACRAKLAKSRIPAMRELVEQYEEAGEPLVVFSAHRAPIDALRDREGWAVVTGSESHEERAATVKRFQAGELKGIGLTIGAGAEGITLTRASHVLFVDLDWTPAKNTQAVDRVRRIGQNANKIVVTRLVSDHALDKRVLGILGAKMALIDAAVEA